MVHIVLAILMCALTSSQAFANVSAIEVPLDGTSRYWFAAFNLSSIEADAAQDGGAQFSTYNQFTMNYSTEYGQTWGFRIPFMYTSAGFNNFDGNEFQKQEVSLADVLVDYTISSTLLPGEIEVFQRYRLELPTSKYSIAQGKIAGVGIDYIASRYINKYLQIEYWPSFRWNIQTQTVYVNPDTGSLSSTQRYELDQRLTLWYRLNHKGAFLGFFVGAEDIWFNESDPQVNNTSRIRDQRFAEHLLKVGPSVRFNLNKNFDFLFSLQNSVPLWGYTPQRTGRISDLGAFKPEQTEFVLLSFIRF